MKIWQARIFQAAVIAVTVTAGVIGASRAHAEESTGGAAKVVPLATGTAPVSHGARPGEPRTGWNLEDFALTPIQSQGRIKPFHSFASDAMLSITSSRAYQGWRPIDFILNILAFPDVWKNKPMFRINSQEVLRQFLMDENTHRFSHDDLVKNTVFLQYAEEQGRRSTPKEGTRQNPRERELGRVVESLMLFRALIDGRAWSLLPRPSPEAWWSMETAREAQDPDPGRAEIRKQFRTLVQAYFNDDRATFESATAEMRKQIERLTPGFDGSVKRHLAAEAHYHQLQPFKISWILYLIAALLWIGQALSKSRHEKLINKIAGGLVAVGFLVHTYGFGLRCYIAGRPPVTNMYESVIWVSWGVMLFSFIIHYFQRQVIIVAAATTLGAFSLIAADASPVILDPGITPLVPVLRSNFWLLIHVLTITLGYAAFALTLGMGNVTLFHYLRGETLGAKTPGGKAVLAKIPNLNQLTYRAMQFGVVLLAAGTILGGWWADYSWGRFWGWDPKEVWALIALLCYLAILHARFTGWMTQFGYAAWTVLAFLSVLMAWYGVNFVLGVGLHSYGFSSGGFTGVVSFVVAQLVYVGAVAAVHHKKLPGLVTK
ncbi:MAG: cytochrome c biogenesis protein [Bacteriovoracia bacterium]